MENLIRNNEKDINIRRYGNILIICGYAIVILSIWSVLKNIINMSFVSSYSDILEEYADTGLAIGIVIILVGLMTLIDLSIRIYIYKCAKQEGMGTKDKGYLYIVLTAILSLIDLLYVIMSFTAENVYFEDSFEIYVSFIIVVLSLISNGELIYSAMKLKAYKKESEDLMGVNS